MSNEKLIVSGAVLTLCEVMPMHVRQFYVEQVYRCLFTVHEMGYGALPTFYFDDWRKQLICSLEMLPGDLLCECLRWAANLSSEIVSELLGAGAKNGAYLH